MILKLEQKIKKLPRKPGVYVYRDNSGKAIYVGKAVNLKHRVSSYFQSGEKDPKTTELITKIEKLDVIECGSEFEALILEAEFIKRYKPKYNIKLKDDKNHVYIKISSDKYPRISVTRQIVDHPTSLKLRRTSQTKYLGPFIDAGAVRSILKQARKIFPFCTCSLKEGEVCLYYHIGLCRGHDEKYIVQKEYLKDIKGLEKLFAGKTDQLEKEFKQEMKKASAKKDFEKAAEYRDKIKYLDKIKKSHFISERDLTVDKGLAGLKKHLDLKNIPSKIESFDISNIMGNHAVGSMVVFRNGVSCPKEYRRFQIRTVKGSNDFAMMAEVLARRFKKREQDKVFLDMPNLVILDGGKGQLSAVLQNVIIPDGVKIVALAKKEEKIFSISSSKSKVQSYKEINLTKGSEAYYLVQRIRDEAHRFAITYHRKIRSKEFFESSLDNIPGIGPKTKKKLISKYGSIEKIKEVSVDELSELVGDKLAKKIKENL